MARLSMGQKVLIPDDIPGVIIGISAPEIRSEEDWKEASFYNVRYVVHMNYKDVHKYAEESSGAMRMVAEWTREGGDKEHPDFVRTFREDWLRSGEGT